MYTLRGHKRRVAVVAASTLLAGIAGLWSGALAGATQYRTKGGEIFAQGYDSSTGGGASTSIFEGVTGPGKPVATTVAWLSAWSPAPDVSAWGGGDIPASDVHLSPSLAGVSSANFDLAVWSSDGSTSAHVSVAETAGAISQTVSNFRYVDHTNRYSVHSHFVGRQADASGTLAVQLSSGAVILPPGTPATGWLGYTNGGTVVVTQP